MVLVQICYTFKQTDASLKTDTCKVPLPHTFFGQITGRYAIQILPIQYPNSDTVDKYVILQTRIFADNNKFKGITITIKAEDGSIYQNSNNPIICKYWYFNIQ